MPNQDQPRDLTIRPVETDEELRLANDLMAKAHCPDYFVGIRWLETCGAGYPGFRREHTRIALFHGELAGALRMNTETVRLGEARLKMGGFCWVTTSPRHRQKGVCRTLMVDTLDYMKAHNYHVAMLFGIPNFYHRFGFATTLADYAVEMAAADALASRTSAYRIREAKPGDIPAIQRIHAANDLDTACSLLRTSAHLTNKWEHCKNARVITSDKGKVTAYLMPVRDERQLRLDEVGMADPAACGNVLHACARLAADEAVGRIRFLAPPRHPFARYLLQFKSRHEMHLVRDHGGMMAFVNEAEALETLIPEWESLLAKSALRGQSIEVTLVVDRVYYRVRAHRGAIDIAEGPGKNRVGLSPADLVHLVTGYRYVQDILAARRRLLTLEARHLLAVLFPKRDPYVWPFDRF